MQLALSLVVNIGASVALVFALVSSCSLARTGVQLDGWRGAALGVFAAVTCLLASIVMLPMFWRSAVEVPLRTSCLVLLLWAVVIALWLWSRRLGAEVSRRLDAEGGDERR